MKGLDNMQVNEAIKERRSIRNYNDKKLNESTLKEILNLGILAPSAKNTQPWYFKVIYEDKILKEKIADMLVDKMGNIALRTSNAIKTSEALVIVYGNINNEVFDYSSIGACIENMLLSAIELGVSSLWIGYILEIEKELRNILPTEKRLVAAIALGYSDEHPAARPRKSLEEVTEFY